MASDTAFEPLGFVAICEMDVRYTSISQMHPLVQTKMVQEAPSTGWA